jgi:hypothetical protein
VCECIAPLMPRDLLSFALCVNGQLILEAQMLQQGSTIDEQSEMVQVKPAHTLGGREGVSE